MISMMALAAMFVVGNAFTFWYARHENLEVR